MIVEEHYKISCNGGEGVSQKKDLSHIFTTKPKTRRHLNGSMPTRKRAAYLMELLFQNEFVKEAPYEIIYQFVVDKAEFIGLDERVVTRYIGRPRKIQGPNENPKICVRLRYPKTGAIVPKEYVATKILPEKRGICQQLGYMKFDYRKEWSFLIFNHEKVPLPYHLKQAFLDSERGEGLEGSKEDLCVLPIGSPSNDREANIETIERERAERETPKDTHTYWSKAVE